MERLYAKMRLSCYLGDDFMSIQFRCSIRFYFVRAKKYGKYHLFSCVAFHLFIVAHFKLGRSSYAYVLVRRAWINNTIFIMSLCAPRHTPIFRITLFHQIPSLHMERPSPSTRHPHTTKWLTSARPALTQTTFEFILLLSYDEHNNVYVFRIISNAFGLFMFCFFFSFSV